MLKAPMFFIVRLGSRTGADRSERCLRQMGGRTPHERRLFANGGRRAAESRANPLSASYGAAFAAPFPFCFSIVRGSMASTRSCTIFKAVSSSFCRCPTVSSISLFLSASCELPSD